MKLINFDVSLVKITVFIQNANDLVCTILPASLIEATNLSHVCKVKVVTIVLSRPDYHYLLLSKADLEKVIKCPQAENSKF